MKIERITIENFFSIEEAIIEIQDGKTLVTGINFDDDGADNSGVGKSSIIASIGWAIFGEVPKNIPVDKVIRFGTSNTFVCVEFDDGTFIKRRRGTKNDLDFFYEGKSCKKRTPSMTQQEIFSKFGMKGTPKQCFLDFLNTVYLNSSTVETFSSNEFSSADRFQFISRIMNLDIWKKASELAKKDKDKIEDELDDVRIKLETNKEFFVGVTEEGLRAELKFLKEKVEESEHELKVLNTKLETINEKNKEGDSLRNKLIMFESDLVNLKSTVDIKKENLDTKITNLEDTLETKRKAKKGLQEIEDSEDSWTTPDSVERITGKIEKLEEEKNKTQEIFMKVTNDLVNCIKEDAKLKDQIENHIQCPHCNNDVLVIDGKLSKHNEEKIVKESNSYLQKTASLEYDEHRLKEELQEKRDKIEEGNSVLDKAKEVTRNVVDYHKELEQLEDDLENNHVNAQKEYDEYCMHSDKEIKDLTELIVKIKKERDEFQEIDTLEVESEIKGWEAERKKYELNSGGCQKTIEDFLAHVKRLSALKSSEKALTASVTSSKFWTKAFIDVRRMIIESSLPRLESTINAYLKKLQMPFQVIIETLREVGSTGKLKEEFNINVLDLTSSRIDTIETYSDGQKKRIGLAICFALNEFLKDRNYPFDFLLIDQLLDTDIDEVGVNMVMEILDSMDSQKIIISHKTELKDKFSNVIWLEKRQGITKVIE